MEALLKEAPRRLEEIRAQLANPPKDDPLRLSDAAASNLERIELAVSQEELELVERRNALKKQEDELSRLLVGAKGLSEDIASRTRTIEQIDMDLKAQVTDEAAAVTQARVLALTARRLLRGSELDTLKLRLGSLDLLTNLAQADRDRTAAEVTRRQPRLDALKQLAQRLREERAKRGDRKDAEAQAGCAAIGAEVPAQVR